MILSKRKIWILFLFVLIVKVTTALFLSHLAQCSNPDISLGNFAVSSGDTFSYTGAMDNYIERGTYYYNNGIEDVYAGRLPHYSIPYWLLRQVFSQSTAYDVTAFFQIAVESLGITAFCSIGFQYLGMLGWYGMAMLLLISTNWTDSSYNASPESLSISTLAFCLYFYIRYLSNRNTANLIFSGLFFAWLTCLKVYYLLLIIPIGLEFIINDYQNLQVGVSLQKIALKGFIFMLPLICFLAPWTIRNFGYYNKLVPFQIDQYAGYPYTKADLACRKFIAAWGGDFTFWEKTSAGCYFHLENNIKCDFKYPEVISSDTSALRLIENTRIRYIRLQQNYSKEEDEKVTHDFEQLTNTFKDSNSIYAYTARVRVLIRFLKHSGSYYLPIHQSNPCFHSWQLIIKLSQSAIYWMSLILGIPGVFFLGFKVKNLLIPFLPLFLLTLFPIFFGSSEWRYFRTIEPSLYLGVIYSLLKILAFVKSKLRLRS